MPQAPARPARRGGATTPPITNWPMEDRLYADEFKRLVGITLDLAERWRSREFPAPIRLGLGQWCHSRKAVLSWLAQHRSQTEGSK